MFISGVGLLKKLKLELQGAISIKHCCYRGYAVKSASRGCANSQEDDEFIHSFWKNGAEPPTAWIVGCCKDQI